MQTSKESGEEFSKQAGKWGKKMDKKYKGKNMAKNGAPSAIYGFGFLGAIIYYLMQADGFWIGVLGVLKAIVWPVFLVFELLKFVGA